MNALPHLLNEEDTERSSKFGCLRGAITGLIIFAAILWVIAQFMPNCDEDSKAVAYARSLSQERLKKLYYDMERLAADESLLDLCYEEKPGETFPEPFSDLQVLKIRPQMANIMVQGCFDHHVYLRFEGFANKRSMQQQRQIVLSWGEREPQAGEQVLWKEQPEKKPDSTTRASSR